MDKSRILTDKLSNPYDEGVQALLEFAQSNKPESNAHSSDREDEDSDYDDDEKLHNSDFEHDDDSESQRGPTIIPRNNQGKIVLSYNKLGVPIGDGAKKLSSFEGKIARKMVPITYASWLDVPEDIKDALWQYALTRFELDPRSRKQVLKSIGIKWRNFKHILHKKFIEPHKNDPQAKLSKPPTMYPFIKKQDWKLFVSHKTSKNWEEQSEKAKSTRAKHKYNHRLSRKGYAGLIADIMKETGKTEEEIDRTMLWKKARELKTGGFVPEVQLVVDKIDKLNDSAVSLGEVAGSYDVLTQALGTDEHRGHVRGLGKYVTPKQYFHEPKTVKHILDIEKKVDRRLNKLEEELEKLKRGISVSEASSCHVGGHVKDFEEEPFEELLDNSCFLAVNVASNIVAKGTITNYNVLGENIEVLMDICIQEALLPIPPEDDPSIVNVKDAVGYILSWPRHLVIRCIDLEKVVEKPMRSDEKPLKQFERRKKNKRLRDEENVNAKENANRDVERMKSEEEGGRELKKRRDEERMQIDDGKKNEKEEGKVEENEHANKDEESTETQKGRGKELKKKRDEERLQIDDGKKNEKDKGKVNENEHANKDEESTETQKGRGKELKKQRDEERLQIDDGKKNEKDKVKVDGKETRQRMMTRAKRKTRVRIQNNAVLKMTEIMVDGHVSKLDSIRVQCEDRLFGYESYTYISCNDFEAVFTLDELSGAVITSYMMYLYEQIKNGNKKDHGICFMSPSSISPLENKAKSKNIDDSSRSIANRLSTRGNNDIIMLPYNPGRHWVLAVLDLKAFTCYYLDSLGASAANSHLKQTIDAAMVLNNARSGSKKRPSKLKWVNARCPRQPGITECGYYVLKFMKEIVNEGVEILVNNNVGGSKEEYTDADVDEIREDWSLFVANFIYK